MGWKFFSKEEMTCRCGCNQCKMDEHFMDMLDSLRKAVGQPLKVNRGYSCEEHDTKLGGKGNHPKGKAVDLDCQNSHLRFGIIYYAIHLGFKRIGIGKTFIHLDLCYDAPPEVVWLY